MEQKFWHIKDLFSLFLRFQCIRICPCLVYFIEIFTAGAGLRRNDNKMGRNELKLEVEAHRAA